MSTFVGVSPQFSCIFSLISRVFTNFNKKFNLIICILDHSVNVLCLSINLKPGLQGQLLKGSECHIYLYCFTFAYIDLNRAFVIIVLFPKKTIAVRKCVQMV